jgi:hypothetical protein
MRNYLTYIEKIKYKYTRVNEASNKNTRMQPRTKSYTSGSVVTGRASHAGIVEG